MRLAPFALLFAVAISSSVRAEQAIPLNAVEGSNVEISASRWLDVLPAVGYAPATVTIRNLTPSDAQWTADATATAGYQGAVASTSASVRVEPRRTGQLALLLPIIGVDGTNSQHNGTIRLTGPGSPPGPAGFSSYTQARTEFFGMSEALARNTWSALETRLKPSGGGNSEIFGSKLTMNLAPRSWRGYTGLADLWITDDEWLALEPPVRNAMKEWVATGGRIYLFTIAAAPKTPEQLQLPAAIGGEIAQGYGKILLETWDGKAVPTNRAEELIKSNANAWASLLTSGVGAWTLPGLVGKFSASSGFVILCTLLFTLVAGPLNLFWFAPAGRRHRLFWTTPLITGLATLFIGAYSVVRDGFGGEGARVIAAFVLPDEHQMAIVQEQVSKTGILLSSSFPTTEELLIQPLRVDSTRNPNWNFSETATARSGWFSSRSVQAQMLKTVRSTRGELTVQWDRAGGKPSVTSSLEFALENVFVQDESGAYFKVPALRTGEKATLTPASYAEFSDWLNKIREAAGPVTRKSLDAAVGQRSTFLATVSEPDKLAISTLASIRWHNQTAVCAGQLTIARP